MCSHPTLTAGQPWTEPEIAFYAGSGRRQPRRQSREGQGKALVEAGNGVGRVRN